jgi:transposase
MQAELLLPGSASLRLDSWAVEGEVLVLRASTTQPVVYCPDCGQPSKAVHSYYTRKPADVACAGFPMCIEMCVRRFYCYTETCGRTTFAERIPSTVAPYARRTSRLVRDQTQVAFVAGGEAGSRLLTLLRMRASPDTLLRLIRRTPTPAVPPSRMLGIDDWALCRGQSYGTILVDLERHRAIDLLPDRSAESLARWLLDHPGVELISRDRAPEYIKGATLGAPTAIQVADRFHLLLNLRETLERLLTAKSACLRAAAQAPRPAPSSTPPPGPSSNAGVRPKLTLAEQDKQARRQRRQERYKLVHQLHQQGFSRREISRQLDLGYRTVGKYLAAESCPFYPEGRRGKSKLDRYLSYLRGQWQAGHHNASQLWREICHQGFTGSRGLVAQWAARARKALPSKTSSKPTTQPPSKPSLAPRQASWLLVKTDQELSQEEQATLHRMTTVDAQVAQVRALAQSFIAMVKARQPEHLGPWLKSVADSGISALQRFADGLRKDLEAVKAALTLPWSQGQVEGWVNKLKFIKRSMYGRANFDLLRQRVLAA